MKDLSVSNISIAFIFLYALIFLPTWFYAYWAYFPNTDQIDEVGGFQKMLIALAVGLPASGAMKTATTLFAALISGLVTAMAAIKEQKTWILTTILILLFFAFISTYLVIVDLNSESSALLVLVSSENEANFKSYMFGLPELAAAQIGIILGIKVAKGQKT